MIGNFYISDTKREILFKFKETNEKLGLNYSATIVDLMEKFNKSNAKKIKDGNRD
tara:strand:+ start:544 stop:708 length:165 start_codon:yes stop_codon:yes gene_type:complete